MKLRTAKRAKPKTVDFSEPQIGESQVEMLPDTTSVVSTENSTTQSSDADRPSTNNPSATLDNTVEHAASISSTSHVRNLLPSDKRSGFESSVGISDSFDFPNRLQQPLRPHTEGSTTRFG